MFGSAILKLHCDKMVPVHALTDKLILSANGYVTYGGTFASKKALGAHAAKAHNYRNVFRHFAVDGQCPACARDFHHRSRLVCHWRTATTGFAKVRACFPPLPNATVDALVQEDALHTADMKAKGWLSTRALLPVFHGQGPGIPDPGSEAAAIMLQMGRQETT